MTISDNFVYPAAEVSKIDNLAMQLSAIPGFVLMRQAADFAYEKAIEFYPDTVLLFFVVLVIMLVMAIYLLSGH